MNLPAPQFYTAAQIAAALGVTARAVKLRLAGIVPSGTVMVRGQSANGWTFAALPDALRVELTTTAARRGLLVEQLLSPVAPWASPVPWHDIPAPFRERAETLCAALALALAKQHDLSGPDLMDLARALYRQHHDHDLADAKLRYVMDRTTKRDNGCGQWHRPELYLDDAAFHQTTSASMSSPAAVEAEVEPNPHATLDKHIEPIVEKSNPTLDDRAYLLHATFQHFEQLIAVRKSVGEQRAFKLSLIRYLYQHVPGLYRPQAAGVGTPAAKPLLAIRSLFNRCLAEWIAGGRTVESLMDKRGGNSGAKGDSCHGCEQKILRAACEFRGPRAKKGNVTLAFEGLRNRRQLCTRCLELKSLPAGMRRRATPNAIQIAYFKGPEFVRDVAPTHHCDWSDSEPGSRFVIDDMTTNEIAWDEVNGKRVTQQVQLLYTEDEFSSYPLPFLLYFGAPNSVTIKRALWHVFTKVGLPHDALYTERGVFANRMLNGEKRAREALHFRELEMSLKGLLQFGACNDDDLTRLRGMELGLRDPALGLKIQHARNPQGKTVERTFYEFQKRASILPGFAGFQQRTEKSRAMQDFDRRVAIGQEHPGNEYLHLSQLRKNYEQVCLEYASRPINGKRHRGLSPLDVWTEALLRRPLRKLPDEIEHLFMLRQLPLRTVRSQGVCVSSFDKHDDFYYFNEHTGPLIGRKVSVRVNYDLPEFIFMEHPDTRKLLKVPRDLILRRTATKEDIANSNAARRAHITGALGEVGNIANPVTSWIVHDNHHTPEDTERGRMIMETTAQHREEQATAARQAVHRNGKAAALGMVAPLNPHNPARVNEGIEWERELQPELEEAEKKGEL